MSVDVLLSRLKKVRRTSGNSWLACCPAHEDRSPSMTIKDVGDGRILIHCFAGCDTEAILGAVGMGWDDVLPEKAIDHHIAPVKGKIFPNDALKVIQHEVRIVLVAAYDLRRGKQIGEHDMVRLEKAMSRINEVVEYAN
jgi:CHC2 zinc finger